MSEEIQSYYANGKLLLSGEYFVLKGAKSLALPVRYGQAMTVKPTTDGMIHWQAFSPNGLWFSCKLLATDFSVIEYSCPEKAKTLSNLFTTLYQLNPQLKVADGLSFQTKMDFDPEWGFGSSSTLVHNLSSWAGVDPFLVNQMCFKGSGFDIACAAADGPILYQQNNPVVPIVLNYPFQNQLYFVYSGAKKRTLGDVSSFLKTQIVDESEIQKMNDLTDHFTSCKTLSDFQVLIRKHEDLVASKIGAEPIKEQLFSDFKGAVKSLGAWGGDFFLAASEEDENSVCNYFNSRGYQLIFNWNELVLKRK